MSEMTLDEVARHRADLERANARGMSLKDFLAWREQLQADYKSLGSVRPMATALFTGALFFLTDPDALVGVTMCNRAMTEDEWREYCSHPASNRRRKPGETIEDDEERARKRRVVALMQEIHDQEPS